MEVQRRIDQLASKEASSTMADEEALGNGGGVHGVDAQEIQNIRLVIDTGDDRIVEILLKGKLILKNSGPPQAAAAAAAGDAAPGHAEDREFLMQMRGWLMTVGTLFVTMAFQAALQPPAWLRTTDFLQLSQSEIDQWKHPFHGASHAAAAAAAPARFAPSPSPSPQAAESATAGLSRRAWAYMICNYCTFGTSLTLVLLLMLLPNKPPLAKFFMRIATTLLVEISLFVVGTVVLGTSEDWRYMLFAAGVIVFWGFACLTIFPLITIAADKYATFRARRAGGGPRP